MNIVIAGAGKVGYTGLFDKGTNCHIEKREYWKRYRQRIEIKHLHSRESLLRVGRCCFGFFCHTQFRIMHSTGAHGR